MERAWLISDAGGAEHSDAVADALRLAGVPIVHHTLLPHEKLPTSDSLRADDVDLVVIMADDVRVNAVSASLDGWEGSLLVLPGSTSRSLATHLHGDLSAEEIVTRAVASPRRIRLPFLEIGKHRAFIALIVGPSSAWGDGPQQARPSGPGRFFELILLLWRLLFSRGVKLLDGTRRVGRHKAVILTPNRNGMDVTALGLQDWMEIGREQDRWMIYSAASRGAGEVERASGLAILCDSPIHALFDGERFDLRSPAHVARRTTRLGFLSTIETSNHSVVREQSLAES